jgi:hypothetical protein
MTGNMLKKIGIGMLLIPLFILFLFTFGEVFSGDLSGLGHLIQAAPLVLIIFLAYKKPFIGGLLLLFAGLALGILYPFRARFELVTIVLVELFLFVPPVISGVLLILSSKKK